MKKKKKNVKCKAFLATIAVRPCPLVIALDIVKMARSLL